MRPRSHQSPLWIHPSVYTNFLLLLLPIDFETKFTVVLTFLQKKLGLGNNFLFEERARTVKKFRFIYFFRKGLEIAQLYEKSETGKPPTGIWLDKLGIVKLICKAVF